VGEVLGNAKKLIFDFEMLDYISSAGLRVLLGTAQTMDGKGEVVVCDLTQSVQDVFELTGFNHLFNIE
jgi:anti-sigma B factor antagonist